MLLNVNLFDKHELEVVIAISEKENAKLQELTSLAKLCNLISTQ